ncbi:manganese catalase family protein [soil metagenome]
MFMRIDKLQYDLPQPKEADPDAAAAVQELMGGRFGEMSTLMNYMFQSFNFRNREAVRPFYEIVAAISAEEMGHVELVAASVNLLLNGPRSGQEEPFDPATTTPFHDIFKTFGHANPHHFIVNGQGALAANSLGQPWQGDYVFNSGNLVLDLLHNFFLECGARTHKMRVYETTDNPAAREMIGYLLVRGGVHTVAYAKALEKLTGVSIPKMLPIPDLSNDKFPEARKVMENGSHTKLYRFSPSDYKNLGAIWNGSTPDGPGECEVVDGTPEGGPLTDLGHAPESFAPEYHPEEIQEIAEKLKKAGGL